MRKGIALRGTLCRKVIKIVWEEGRKPLLRKMRNSDVPSTWLTTTQTLGF